MQEFKSISYMYICPGARNQPIFKSIQKYEIPNSIEFDERSASFKALGMSKITSLPVAIVTTSGTAVGETLPAMMEAYHDNLKLVVISYDRPTRLKQVNSPQTTHQESALTSYARSNSFSDDLYPKHINIEIDLESKIIEIDKRIESDKKSLIIINKSNDFTIEMYNLLKDMDVYIHQELESYFYNLRNSSEILSESKLEILYKSGKISSIYRIGKTPNCGIWRKLEKTINPPQVFHIIEEGQYKALSIGKQLPIESLFKNLNQTMIKSNDIELNILKMLNEKYIRSEQSLLNQIIEENDIKNNIFYFGNSMPIRFAKATLIKNAQICVSRGLNGIDGQLSTAIGIAAGTKKSIICIIGDQTFTYDLNCITKNMPSNLKIFIINNNGGRIFDWFGFERKMINEHNTKFEQYFQFKENIHEIIPDNNQTRKYLEDLNQGLEDEI